MTPSSNKATHKKKNHSVMYKCVMTSPSYDVVPIFEFRTARKGTVWEPTNKSVTTKKKVENPRYYAKLVLLSICCGDFMTCIVDR